MKLEKEILDNWLRSNLNESDLPFEEAHWEHTLKALDDADGQKGAWWKRALMLGGVLLLGTVAWLWNSKSTTAPIAQNTSTATTSTATASTNSNTTNSSTTNTNNNDVITNEVTNNNTQTANEVVAQSTIEQPSQTQSEVLKTNLNTAATSSDQPVSPSITESTQSTNQTTTASPINTVEETITSNDAIIEPLKTKKVKRSIKEILNIKTKKDIATTEKNINGDQTNISTSNATTENTVTDPIPNVEPKKLTRKERKQKAIAQTPVNTQKASEETTPTNNPTTVVNNETQVASTNIVEPSNNRDAENTKPRNVQNVNKGVVGSRYIHPDSLKYANTIKVKDTINKEVEETTTVASLNNNTAITTSNVAPAQPVAVLKTKKPYTKSKKSLKVIAQASIATSPKNATNTQSTKVAPYIGVMYQVPLTKRWDVQMGLAFTAINGLNYTYTASQSAFAFGGSVQRFSVENKTLYQLSVPVNVSYKLGLKHSLQFGLGANLNLDVLSKVKDFNTNTTSNQFGYSHPYNRINAIGNFGYTYQVLPFLSTQIMYQPGLTDITNNTFLGNNIIDRGSRFNFGLIYKIK